MRLGPREKIWAQRLVEVQKDREELIRLLGLLNQLAGIGAREDSLDRAANHICANLANYLMLDYCALYVYQDQQWRLAGFSGQSLPPQAGRMVLDKVSAGNACNEQVSVAGGSRRLLCLPLKSSSRHLGGLAIIPGPELDQRDHRHLRLVVDAVIPVLETFLLRAHAHRLNLRLELKADRRKRGLQELLRHNLHAETCLEQALLVSRDPLFLVDRAGCLVRFNPALVRLLGWEGEDLYGRYLPGFFADPRQWDELQRLLSLEGEIRQYWVKLSVHSGRRLDTLLFLHPLLSGQELVGCLGRFQRPPGVEEESPFMVPLPEARGLVQLCGEVLDQVGDLVAGVRSHLELLLLGDLEPKLRQRLELLEAITHDHGDALERLSQRLERVSLRCGRVESQADCWGGGPQKAPSSRSDSEDQD